MPGGLDFSEDAAIQRLFRSLSLRGRPEAGVDGRPDHLRGVHGALLAPQHLQSRYYNCVHTMKHPDSECPIRQVPGGDIEHQVLEQLRNVLTAPEIITNVARASKMTPRQVTETFSKEFWMEVTPGECQCLMQLLLETVTIYPDKIVLTLRTDGLSSIRDAYGNDSTPSSKEENP